MPFSLSKKDIIKRSFTVISSLLASAIVVIINALQGQAPIDRKAILVATLTAGLELLRRYAFANGFSLVPTPDLNTTVTTTNTQTTTTLPIDTGTVQTGT